MKTPVYSWRLSSNLKSELEPFLNRRHAHGSHKTPRS